MASLDCFLGMSCPLFALFVQEAGNNIGLKRLVDRFFQTNNTYANAPSVFSVENKADWRIVTTALITSEDLKNAIECW